MAKYYDIDTPVRINNTLTMGGSIIVPSSYSIDATGGGEIKGDIISGNTLRGNGSAITNLSSSAMTDVFKLDGTRDITGTLAINRANTHIALKESGVTKWNIESSSGLKIIETGVDTRLTIAPGGATTLKGNLSVAGYSITASTINATSNLQENGINLSTKYEAKGTTHDDRYYTETEIDTLLGGKANASHTHAEYDKYSNWNVQVGTGVVESVASNQTLQFIAGTSVTITRSGKAITINSDDTWRPIDTTPTTSTTNSISSSWAKSHSETTGIGGHVPTGGTASTYLRGDGTWGTVATVNNYVTSITSTAGGNGTFTLKQNGLADLTLNLAHNHDSAYLGIGATATNSSKLENLTASQFLRSDIASSLNADMTLVAGKKIVIPANASKMTVTTGSAITAGVDSASSTDASIRIHSSYGFGVASSYATGTVAQGNNAFWVDVRTGHSYTNGEFYAQQNKRVWHEGNLSTSSFVVNNANNQSVKTGFVMEGTSYAGASSSAGNFVVRTAGGNPGIQLTGDGTSQLSGVGVYLNSNGTGRFTGQLQVGSLKIDNSTVVQNLNAEMVGGTKEKHLAKNRTVSDILGYGVLQGMQISQQTVPNMTVQVGAGVAFTNSGMRIEVTTPVSVALSSASTSYDRIDTIYIQGSIAGDNEGVISVLAGTPSATPVEPTLPAGAVKLATIRVLRNIGSILNTHITNTKDYLQIRYDGNGYVWANKIKTNAITSETGNVLEIEKTIKLPSATSLIIPSGHTKATWTHNLGLGDYAVSISTNNVEPHAFWSGKTSNAITIELDDACESDTTVDVVLIAF